MENTDIIVGLDIGTTKICAIVGRKTEYGKVEVLGFGKADSLGVSRGMVVNIDKTVNGIITAIEQAAHTADAESIEEVYVGVAGQHIKSHQKRGMITRSNEDAAHEINYLDVRRLVSEMGQQLSMNAGEKIIHIIPQEYVIDNEPGILDPVGMMGVRMEATFHIISGQTASIQNVIKCGERANLYYKNIILQPLAAAEAVLSPEEKEAGVVLVDIGGGTTDVLVFYKGILRHTAVIPLGGNVVTDDIVEGLSILKSQAEALKTQFGSALVEANSEMDVISIPSPAKSRAPIEVSKRELAYIIQARMEEIIEFIYTEIKKTGLEKKLIAGIVLTGGGALLHQLTYLVEACTGMVTRVGYPTEHLTRTSFTELSSPIYATCIGLVIKGIQEQELEISQNNGKTYRDEYTISDQNRHSGKWFKKLIDPFKEWVSEDVKNID